MYRDQFGEFVCGYWGLKVNSLANREILSHFYGKREFVPHEKIFPLTCTLLSASTPKLVASI